MKIIITGGHHSSALPVISFLTKDRKDINIYWFGHRHSVKGNTRDTLEYLDIQKLGIPFFDIKAGKFYKTFDPIRLLKIPYGFFQTLFLLIKIRPDVILSFGGYLAVPTVLAGAILGIPSVTHEQTVVVGYANKLISKFARKVMISWEESKSYFPKNKVVYTGLPLRKSLFEIRSSSFVFENNLPVVYVTAGKTGSHIINNVIEESLSRLLGFCNVVHQCGDHSENLDFERLSSWSSEHDYPGRYIARKYVLDDEIGEIFAKSDLIISRSGAHTTKELFEFGKKCILVPIPWVSHNEQYRNAEVLKKAGLGIIIDEEKLTSDFLVNTVKNVLKEASKARYVPTFDNTSARKIAETTLLYAKNKD